MTQLSGADITTLGQPASTSTRSAPALSVSDSVTVGAARNASGVPQSFGHKHIITGAIAAHESSLSDGGVSVLAYKTPTLQSV